MLNKFIEKNNNLADFSSEIFRRIANAFLSFPVNTQIINFVPFPLLNKFILLLLIFLFLTVENLFPYLCSVIFLIKIFLNTNSFFFRNFYDFYKLHLKLPVHS